MPLFRPAEGLRIVEIAVSKIVGNPYQPRRDVDEKHLQQLTQSVAAYGVIVPIIVRPRPNGKEYELVAGQRRLLACRRLGWKKVPAVVRHYDDQQVMEVGLLENLQRRNLSAVEEAEALKRMSQEFVRLSRDELARKMGVDPNELQLREQLLGLSMVAREAVITGLITTEHAIALLPLMSEDDQVKALTRIHREDLSVSETRRMVQALLGEQRQAEIQARPEIPPPLFAMPLAPLAAPESPALPPPVVETAAAPEPAPADSDWDLDGVRRLNAAIRALHRGDPSPTPFLDLARFILAQSDRVRPAEFLDLTYRESNGKTLSRHLWNVAKIAAFVGAQGGYAGHALETLVHAALLYDVGMLEVPEEILAKKETLAAEEMAWIQRHPVTGSALLAEMPGLSPVVAQVALEHHERCDGSGYPRHTKDEQTHPFSRLIAVADAFEAVSAPRAHRPPATPRVAMQAIVLNTYKGVYDRNTVRNFLQAMSLYPVGSLVRLGTGELARVVRCVPTDVTRPVVEMVTDPANKLCDPRELDLSATPGITISDELGLPPGTAA